MLRISWSAIQTFLSCQRKYALSYIEGLQRIPSADNRNLMLGSAFHAGIEAALLAAFDASVGQYTMTTTWLVDAAVKGSTQYLKDATIKNKQVKDYDLGGLRLDYDYYAMVDELRLLVPEMLKYHIPLIGIGSRYIVPSVHDVALNQYPSGAALHGQEPKAAVEMHFEYPLNKDTLLTGYVDTILWDDESKEYVIFDWKTRNVFPDDRMALIDGQAHLYAAVINAMAKQETGQTPISKVTMYQFLNSTPKPASISKKSGLPNTGAESYATTWEVWKATLPKGIKAERYEAEMRPKLKDDSYWQRPVSGIVTDASSQLALDNVYSAVYAMKCAFASNHTLPASLSSKSCEYCDFAMLCTNVLRYGGDPTSIISEFYQERNK